MPTKLSSAVLNGGQAKCGRKIAQSTLSCARETLALSWKTMVIFEPRQPLEVDTPKGRGRIWLVTDYGTETEKLFTVVMNDSGEMWEFTNKDIKATSNLTMGRGQWK